MKEAEAEMGEAASKMEFERAALFRDRLMLLRDMGLGRKPPQRALLSEAGATSAGGMSPKRKQAAGRGRRRRDDGAVAGGCHRRVWQPWEVRGATACGSSPSEIHQPGL